MLCHCCRGLRFYHLRCSAIVAPVVTAAAIVVATQAIRRTMTMTIASEHAHDQVSKQTLKVVLLQLSLCLTGSVIQLVLIEVVVIIHSSLDDDWVNERYEITDEDGNAVSHGLLRIWIKA